MFRAILCSSSGGENCIFTAYGIVTLPCSAPFESGLQSALNRRTARSLTESDDTRCCKNNFDLLKISIVLLQLVEVFNVTHILQNKGILHQVGN
jgi:hypothetical protein